jgi:hypothetical protein
MTRLLGWLGLASCALLIAPAFADSVEMPPPEQATSHAAGPAAECRVVDLEFQPAAAVQLVAWVEDTDGNFIDTVYITQQTGSFGLGNRPGVFGMRSGPNWPYGPRLDVFPVWSHRHGQTWPRVHFQNGDGDPGGAIDCADTACRNDQDRNLSHPFDESSAENHFSRPLKPTEPAWDVGSGASQAFTDKGTLGPEDSLYPPRDDITTLDPNDYDDPVILTYDDLNPFDAVSQATPLAGTHALHSWLIPPELYAGSVTDYVMFVEVNTEFDPNDTYSPATLPTATSSSWTEYGQGYRGQPSVVYRLPFQIGIEESRVSTAEVIGYGDPLAADGNIRPLDGTIDTDRPGSGAMRLELIDDDGDQFHVRVEARFEDDQQAPAAVGDMLLVIANATTAEVELTAPGDDGSTGRATGYDVRYRAGEPITYENFGDSPRVLSAPDPEAAGTRQTVEIDGLLPATTYYVGIRAYDACRNYGDLATIQLVTSDRASGEVDACFIATAAYGSVMATDVQMLRRFRDQMLRTNVLGELFVEAYYTFGPAVAGIVGNSDLLRQTTRAALGPIVDRVKDAAVVDPTP